MAPLAGPRLVEYCWVVAIGVATGVLGVIYHGALMFAPRRLAPPHSDTTIVVMNGITHVLIDGWESVVYTITKTLALFSTTALAFRFLQRRAIAQFTPIDWLTAVVCGSVIGRAATATDTSWIQAATAVLTLIAVNVAVSRLRFVPGLKRIVDPPLRVLIHDGNVNHRNLRRCGLTDEDLGAIVRQHGYLNVADVKLALFERTGSISVLASPAATSAACLIIPHPQSD